MKKSTAGITVLFTLIFLCNGAKLGAQQTDSISTVPLENQAASMHVYTLQNGFQIFAKQDTTTALVRVEFIVKAGFSAQTPSTAGFFPLYTSLFLSDDSTGSESILSSVKIESSCNDEDSTFIASAAPDFIPQLLLFIANRAQHPQLQDKQIASKYSEMKKQVLSYAKDTTGFINSAIDARIFSTAPWKHDSGIYPALFTKYTTGEVRTILTKIANQYYVPENCALFVSGNISEQQVYELAKKYFSSWTGYYTPLERTAPSTQTATSQKHKFVLTDNAFSKDFTQLVVQYVSLKLSQADILAASSTSASSPYKENVLANPALAVRSKDYLTAASSPLSSFGQTEEIHSRLIFQALMEQPYSFAKKNTTKEKISVPQQVDLFIDAIEQSSRLSRPQFVYAQNMIASKYRTQTGDTAKSMALLADYWALDESFRAEHNGLDFYNHFLDVVHLIQSESEESVANAITADEPYIFVLVNTSVYDAQKKFFDDQGYEQITNKNASWYSDELVKNNAFDQESLAQQNNDDSIPIEEQKQPSFYDSNMAQFSSAHLDNNIPIVIKQNPGSEAALISIAINGGELQSPANERFLRTILINAFAGNIQKEIAKLRHSNVFIGDTKLSAWTDDTCSYITISCIADDIEHALTATANAILLGDIEPVTADRLVLEQKNQWNIKSASLSYQMTCAALATFLSGTELAKLYDTNTGILKDTTFDSISFAYTQLLDASLYSIVIIGDVPQEGILAAAKNTFGVLKQQTERSSIIPVDFSIARTTRKVLLRHTFTTDVAAEDAGERPEVLVPTTDFYDPVQFWMQAPAQSDRRALFNAVLYELNRRVQKECDDTITCSVQPATFLIHSSCIQGDAVLHTNRFLAAYKKAVRLLLADLTSDDGTLAKKISASWIQESLGKTATNDGTAQLIQSGISSGNATQYLDDYRTVTGASQNDFLQIVKECFPEDPAYKQYSADSKK